MNGKEIDKPVLQILGSKCISTGGEGKEPRYRLLVSDGKYQCGFAMLATQLNEMLQSGKLADLTIIRLDRTITSVVNPEK